MNYWYVKFESYNGQGNAIAYFETKEAAQKVYDDAVATIGEAMERYARSGKDQVWVGERFSFEDCFGTKTTVNLANHVIALNSIDMAQRTYWKTFSANKGAEQKYKELYDIGTAVGIKYENPLQERP